MDGENLRQNTTTQLLKMPTENDGGQGVVQGKQPARGEKSHFEQALEHAKRERRGITLSEALDAWEKDGGKVIRG